MPELFASPLETINHATRLACGNLLRDSPDYEGPEFAEPRQPMLIVGTNEGLRIVLSSNSFDERDAPELLIERRPHGWVVMVHPDDGDPAGVLAIRDDGEVFLERDDRRVAPDSIHVLEPGADTLELN